jgi:hypothetical protein
MFMLILSRYGIVYVLNLSFSAIIFALATDKTASWSLKGSMDQLNGKSS